MDNPYCDLPYWTWQVIENYIAINSVPNIAWTIEVPDTSLARLDEIAKCLWDKSYYS